jgi:hypothetical protein
MPDIEANDLTTAKRQPLQRRLNVAALLQDIGIDGFVKEFLRKVARWRMPRIRHSPIRLVAKFPLVRWLTVYRLQNLGGVNLKSSLPLKPPSCPFFLQVSLDTLILHLLHPLFPFIMSMEVDTPLSFQPGAQSAATYAIFSNPLKVKY